MGDSFFFQTFYLSDDRRSDLPARADLQDAVLAAGWRLRDAAQDANRSSLRVAKDDLGARVSLPRNDGSWALSVPDDQLRWADGRPDEAAQAPVVDLVRKLLEIAPPYVGVSCWPFGPSTPEVYDQSPLFALREVGSVMFLSDRYVSLHLVGVDLDAAPVRRHEELSGGRLLIADDDLLQSADDGDLDDLQAFFGLAPTGRH